MSKNLFQGDLTRCLILTMGIFGLVSTHRLQAQPAVNLPFIGRLTWPDKFSSRCSSGSFANVAEKLLPTVVNISTSRVLKPGSMMMKMMTIRRIPLLIQIPLSKNSFKTI